MQGRIDQILAGFAQGDAIANEASLFRDRFRGWGIESDIFVDSERIAPDSVDSCLPLEQYVASPADVAIHHYSITSPAVDLFLESPARKILRYHNITPGHFFDGYDDGIAWQLRNARRELGSILPKMDATWAVSGFNARELEEMGDRSVRVLPLLFSPSQFDREPDPYAANRFGDDMQTLLFVGRIAPNKRLEDLLSMFAWYHNTIERNSRLVVVGSDRSAPRYFTMLRMLVNELNLSNVCLERFASPERLPGYYDVADIFVTTSEHEGYCLPLIEAMHKGVPVVARHRGGMPEALGGAGITYDDMTPPEIAGLVHRLLTDERLRREVLTSQNERMQQVRSRDADAEIRKLIAEL